MTSFAELHTHRLLVFNTSLSHSLVVRRGKGRATSVAVGSECLLVVTSRAVLLRYDFTVGSQPGAALLHSPCGV